MKIEINEKTLAFVNRALDMRKDKYKNATAFVNEACFLAYKIIIDEELRKAGTWQTEQSRKEQDI